MVYDPGDIKVMNSSKEIDLNTTLPAMIDFRNALRQAKIGYTNMDSIEQQKLTDNQRKLNQIRGLSMLISAQETLITLSSSQIGYRSWQKYQKDNKEIEDRTKWTDYKETGKKVEDMIYDINRLNYWDCFLKQCRSYLIIAEETKEINDDFIIEQIVDGEIAMKLTKNFWDMLEDLQKSYSEIHLLMLVNKIISSGVEQDEELSYKETEQLFIERVRDA